MPETSTELTGKIALVTGAGSGIGRAIAEALAARRATVICAGRRLDRLAELAAALGNAAEALQLDVTDPASTSSVVDRLPAALRPIDILVNNAGHDIGGRRRFDQGDVEDWTSIIETNVNGTIRVSRAVIPGMIERGAGQVVNLGS